MKLSQAQERALSLIATSSCSTEELPGYHQVYHTLVARSTLLALEKKGLIFDWQELGYHRYVQLSDKGRTLVLRSVLERQSEREDIEVAPITLTFTEGEQQLLLKVVVQTIERLRDRLGYGTPTEEDEEEVEVLDNLRGRLDVAS